MCWSPIHTSLSTFVDWLTGFLLTRINKVIIIIIIIIIIMITIKTKSTES